MAALNLVSMAVRMKSRCFCNSSNLRLKVSTAEERGPSCSTALKICGSWGSDWVSCCSAKMIGIRSMGSAFGFKKACWS